MILTEYVEMRWNGNNKKYYQNLGYKFTFLNDIFSLNIKDLKITSNYKILCRCDNCNAEKKLSYKDYIKNTKNLLENYYCSKCGIIKYKKTNLEKYGVEFPIQNEKIKEKTKLTCLEKYGEICPSKNINIQNKIKNTNLEKYGVECIFQNDDIKEQIKNTNLEKYGVEYSQKNHEIKEKIKNTCVEKYGTVTPLLNIYIMNKTQNTNIEKYGVDNIFKSNFFKKSLIKDNLEKYGVEYNNQRECVKNKIKNTNLEKYGVECVFQNDDIKKQIRNTNLEKYGVKHPLQNDEIKEKIKQTCLKKYGFEYPSQNPEIVEKTIQTNIDRYGEAFIHYIPKYNPISIVEFDIISEKLNLKIQHALNGGEKKFERYWVDCYLPDYNICIEWDEPKHFSEKNKIKDEKRQQYIEKKFNCKFIRINQKKWFDETTDEQLNFYLKINSMIKK